MSHTKDHPDEPKGAPGVTGPKLPNLRSAEEDPPTGSHRITPPSGRLSITPSIPTFINLTTATGPLAAVPELYVSPQAPGTPPRATPRQEVWVENLKLRMAGEAAEALSRSEALRSRFRQDNCEAFVLVADLRRSTELMLKATSPKAFGGFISELMDAVHAVITENHGVVDKFMGDGVLAYFPMFFSGADAAFHVATVAEKCLSFARTSSDSVDDGRRSRERPRNAKRAWTGVGSRAVRSVDWDRERPDGRKLPGRDGWWGLTQASRRT